MRFILKSGIALLSLILALLLASVVLEIMRSRSTADVGKEESRIRSVHADPRSKIEVIRDLRAKGVGVIAERPGAGHSRKGLDGILAGGKRIYPFTGISGVTTVQGIELDQYMIFVSDEHGFNNPTGLYKPDGVEVMVVGDSFVRGEYVSPESNAVAKVRATYPGTINLGCNAIGPWSMLGLIREYAKPLSPRVVVWCYYEGNDLMNIRDERLSHLTSYTDPDYAQGLIDCQPVIDDYFRRELNRRIAEEIRQIDHHHPDTDELGVAEDPLDWRRVVKLSRIRELVGLVRNREATEYIKEYEYILELARKEVEAWGGQLLFVYLPQWSSFQRLQRSRWMFENYRDDILAVVLRLELPLVDVYARFQAEGDPSRFFPYRGPGHYNCEGYKVMGDSISKKIGSLLSFSNAPDPYED